MKKFNTGPCVKVNAMKEPTLTHISQKVAELEVEGGGVAAEVVRLGVIGRKRCYCKWSCGRRSANRLARRACI
jgi:hypothetical protein